MISKSQQRFWWWVVGLGLFHSLSWLAYQLPDLRVWAMLGVGLLGLWLAVWRPHWLAYASVAELVIGGQGYLLFTEIHGFRLTLRMILFGLVLLAGGMQWLRRRQLAWNPGLTAAVYVLGWVSVLAAVGLARGYGLSNVFSDANGYFYIAMAFGWWLILRAKSDWRSEVFTIVFAGSVVIGLKSWMTMTLFGQAPVGIDAWYQWIRNTGTGEITHIQGNIWRVFFQSQIYCLLAALIAYAGLLMKRAESWWLWPLFFGSLGTVISLSRSFWLGGAVAVIGLTIWAWRRQGWKILWTGLLMAGVATGIWLMLSWSINWPYVIAPTGQSTSPNPIAARFDAPGSAQAADARRLQLQPLWQAILHQPVVGHGFGASLTYYNPDPRIQALHSTHTFELGYLDQWFKMGLVGLLLLAWLLGRTLRKLAGTKWWELTVGTVLAIGIVHIFSPYLNHPLGLGWIALLICLAYDPN